MKKVGYINSHIKTISYLNVLRVITKFHKTDMDKKMVAHYLLSKYAMKKLINILGDHGLRSVYKKIDKFNKINTIQPRLPYS